MEHYSYQSGKVTFNGTFKLIQVAQILYTERSRRKCILVELCGYQSGTMRLF